LVFVSLHEGAASRESLRMPGFPVSLAFHMVRGNWYVSIPEELIFSAGEESFSEAQPTFE